MKLPYPPGSIADGGIRGYLMQLVTSLSQTLTTTIDTRTPVGSLLLASPDGSVYSVQVTDAGVLTATKVYDAP